MKNVPPYSFPDLLYHIAHGYPGKVPALAQRMGKVPGTLLKKLDPGTTSHGIDAEEIEMLLDFCSANGLVARHFADKADLLVIPKIIVDGSDMQLLEGFMEVVAELGEFSTKFTAAYADGNISWPEFMDLAKEGADVMSRMAGFIDRVKQLAEKDPRRE
jgi:hypothetical protein